MSIETSKKVLKVTGIITLIFGILGVIAGIVLILGARVLGGAGTGKKGRPV